MAGIGFELLKLWKQGTYQSLLRAYALTTMMVSGPGLLIILSLGVICFFTIFSTPFYLTGYQFLSTITYLLSSSMITASALQYTFSRFISDKVFSKDFEDISPNYLGVLFIQLVMSILLALPIVLYFFAKYSLTLKILLISSFIILCLIWLSVVILTGIKAYHLIIWGFTLGYYVMIVVHLVWGKPKIESLLFEFLLAQIVLFLFLLHAILDYYPSSVCIRFDFLKKENIYYYLIGSSFFYALGFWIDKFLFWMNDNTGFMIFDPLRLSPLYDLPMFLSYITVIPAASAFLLQIEANFALKYPRYMQAIFQRKTLEEISVMRDELLIAARDSIYTMFKSQALLIVTMILSACFLFSIFDILPLYLNLLFILLVAVSLNLILWGLLNILYYLTLYNDAFYVSLIFVVANFSLSWASLKAGPYFFGYGYAAGSLLGVVCALFFINKGFRRLEYKTFMLID